MTQPQPLTDAQLSAVKKQLGLPASADLETTYAAARLQVEASNARAALAATDPSFAGRVGAAQADEVRATAVYLAWRDDKPQKAPEDPTRNEVTASAAYKNWR